MIRHRPLEKRGEKEKRKERIGRRKRREESEKGGGQGEGGRRVKVHVPRTTCMLDCRIACHGLSYACLKHIMHAL